MRAGQERDLPGKRPLKLMNDQPILWFIAQLKPNGINNALRNLGRQGFAVFHPRQTATRRVRDKLVTREEPVFPGYLFVTFDPATAPWRRINATLGVARLLTTPSLQPATVPPAFMAALMTRFTPEGLVRPPEVLNPGDLVRIQTGPFADVVTRIESLDRDGRVGVLLEVMGQAVRVSLAAGTVSKET
jgi:transcriptional antiterminator RfaH